MTPEMPKIRLDLDFMPSPVPDRPGLLIRDPYGYSQTTLIVPPLLVPALRFLDGEASELDLPHYLVQATGDLQAGDLAKHLIDTLDEAGFLDNERFQEIKAARHREFAECSERKPTHTGPGGYPEDAAELRAAFDDYFRQPVPEAAEGTIAIAAPHVSPFGGWESYRDAYSSIPRSAGQKTFIVLGTSHYGAPDRFGLTRKAFVTPYGATRTAPEFIDRLAAAADGAVLMEDYCHAIEHSIEFQVVFLQHLFGPSIRVLPILCGPYGRSFIEGGLPEDDERILRFYDALGEIQARHGDELFWVLGVDMAHIGKRYGDQAGVQAHTGFMTEIEERDKSRIDSISNSDAAGFWEQVRENRDPLRWCGAAPIYTFLRTVKATGTMERYQQWNIDEGSVVSFAAIRFSR